MKILYIIIGLQNEGISNSLLQRLNSFSEREGFEIHLLSESENNPEMISKLKSSVNIHEFNLKDLTKKRRIPWVGYFSLQQQVRRRYRMFLNKIRPDLIVTFNLEYHARSVIPNIAKAIPTLIEIRGSYLGYKDSPKHTNILPKLSRKNLHPLNIFRPNSRNTHNKYNYAMVLTREDLEDRKYLKIPVFQVYNSVSVAPAPSDFASRSKIIIAAGRLSEDKNFGDLIAAVSKVKPALEGWEVHIYGEGPCKKMLQELITSLELNNLVFLKGNSYDMPSVYNDAKLLVSTSLTEGFGRTLIEALFYKIPVISYNCKCGPKEILRDNVNGFLIDFSPEQLSTKLVELTNNAELLQSFSDNTSLDLARFDFVTNMKQWEEIYLSIQQASTS